MNTQILNCSLCGVGLAKPDFQDYFGNNPWPLNVYRNTQTKEFYYDEATDDTFGARCCDDCNSNFVIPMRMSMNKHLDPQDPNNDSDSPILMERLYDTRRYVTPLGQKETRDERIDKVLADGTILYKDRHKKTHTSFGVSGNKKYGNKFR